MCWGHPRAPKLRTSATTKWSLHGLLPFYKNRFKQIRTRHCWGYIWKFAKKLTAIVPDHSNSTKGTTDIDRRHSHALSQKKQLHTCHTESLLWGSRARGLHLLVGIVQWPRISKLFIFRFGAIFLRPLKSLLCCHHVIQCVNMALV
jgi:hypothetical protein